MAAGPIDTPPLFVKAGSVVPLGSEVESTQQTQTIASVRVYPGAGRFLGKLRRERAEWLAHEPGDRCKLRRQHERPVEGHLPSPLALTIRG